MPRIIMSGGHMASITRPSEFNFRGAAPIPCPWGFNFRGASTQTPVKADIRGADDRMTMGFDSKGGSTFLYMLHVSIVSISDIFYSRRTGYFTIPPYTFSRIGFLLALEVRSWFV